LTRQERLLAGLSSIFGGLALLLAAVGLYGVRAYAVARRIPEIGIRAALGADRGMIGKMILRETGWLAFFRVSIGLAIARFAVLLTIIIVDTRLQSSYSQRRMRQRVNRKPNPLPFAAELEILAALWRLGPSTVREVHEALGKDIGYTTTLKQMQLMHEKGLLSRSERFRSHVYEPGMSKERTQQQVARDIMARVFDNSAKSLVMGALAAQPTSDEELAEIRKMLANYARERGSSK
jgi:BlaI family penicillinase repressor